MTIQPMPELHAHNGIMPFVVAFVAIALASLLREPAKQKWMAIIIGGASGTYLNGGLGYWEFPFAIAMLCCAYKGLESYRWVGMGWLLHTCCDALHHCIGHPMLSIMPASSFECAITDTILALWFFMGAPSLWQRPSNARQPS